MSIPTWLTCTAADVQTDSRMTAYSAYKSNDDGEFLAEISRRVTEWSDVVINRLRFAAVKNGLVASFDNDLTTVLNAEQQKQACLALKLLVISALWQNLPGADAQYNNQANDTGLSSGTGTATSVDRRITSGEGLLSDLEKQIKIIAEAAGADSIGASGVAVTTRPIRVDAYTRYR